MIHFTIILFYGYKAIIVNRLNAIVFINESQITRA